MHQLDFTFEHIFSNSERLFPSESTGSMCPGVFGTLTSSLCPIAHLHVHLLSCADSVTGGSLSDLCGLPWWPCIFDCSSSLPAQHRSLFLPLPSLFWSTFHLGPTFRQLYAKLCFSPNQRYHFLIQFALFSQSKVSFSSAEQTNRSLETLTLSGCVS